MKIYPKVLSSESFFNFNVAQCFILEWAMFCFKVKVRRENELNALKEEIQGMQKRFQELISQARMESDQRIQECEELRMQVKFIYILKLVEIECF